MEVRVITWNLFHGRDRAPDAGLHTWRSRLLRVTERGATAAQVNRELFDQFSSLLSEAEWDIALLQECPPRWAERLAHSCDAEPHLVLTSRNLRAPLDRVQGLAASLNPDLLASWEGGSNLTLVRGTRRRGRTIAERRDLTLAGRPEHRRMALTRLSPGLCLANLHASVDRIAAEREVDLAARTAVRWAGSEPLILGGDLNLRPESSAALFDALERDEGLAAPTSPTAIDHLLARGIEVIQRPVQWPTDRRQVPDPTAETSAEALPITLSDHAPVEAAFELAGGGTQPG